MADFRIEEKLLEKGYRNITGIDEAGRGSLFGPVIAAAVMFSDAFIHKKKEGWAFEINDSKLITPRKRRVLARAILASAIAVGVGITTNKVIDRENIHWASFEAMRRAVAQLSFSPDFLLVDGFRLPGVHHEQMGLRQGDNKSITIAAASIIAKVLRDRMMANLDNVYEGYDFSKHKGYGTRRHFRVLEEKGPTGFHRCSFGPMNRGRQ